MIQAGDGRGNSATESETFTLEPSLEVNPGGGSPGETIQVQLYDFDSGDNVSEVQIGRLTLWQHSGSMANMLSKTMPTADTGTYSKWTPASGSTSSPSGELNFKLVIPNDAVPGVRDLKVFTDGGQDAATNIAITGPVVTSTPSTVVANQRISLVGTGFTPGSKIDRISFGGEDI